jgi:hypothetical protein
MLGKRGQGQYKGRRSPEGPRTDYLLLRAAAAGQRLYTFDLFACLLINGCVPKVDVPVQARVRVVPVVVILGGWVRWARGRLLLVHSEPPSSVGRAPGCS